MAPSSKCFLSRSEGAARTLNFWVTVPCPWKRGDHGPRDCVDDFGAHESIRFDHIRMVYELMIREAYGIHLLLSVNFERDLRTGCCALRGLNWNYRFGFEWARSCVYLVHEFSFSTAIAAWKRVRGGGNCVGDHLVIQTSPHESSERLVH